MYRPPSLPVPPSEPSLSSRNPAMFMSTSSSSASSRSRNTTLSPPPSIPNASSILPSHHSNNALAQQDSSSSASSSSSSTTAARTPHFDPASIRPHIRPLLAQSLAYVEWEKDKADRLAAIRKQIAVDIKSKMVHAEPEGFKYAVAVQVEPNCGQAIKANVACHWDDDSDAVLHEVYSNDSIVCTVVAFAIRVAY